MGYIYSRHVSRGCFVGFNDLRYELGCKCSGHVWLTTARGGLGELGSSAMQQSRANAHYLKIRNLNTITLRIGITWARNCYNWGKVGSIQALLESHSFAHVIPIEEITNNRVDWPNIGLMCFNHPKYFYWVT